MRGLYAVRKSGGVPNRDQRTEGESPSTTTSQSVSYYAFSEADSTTKQAPPDQESDRPGRRGACLRRAVSPFVGDMSVGAPAPPLGGGMPARMPAQHAESVRHVAFGPHISESRANSWLSN